MGKADNFLARLAMLADEAGARPERFGEGVRLLFSCRSDNLPADLALAQLKGVEARGVGRMHILVEVEDDVPDAEWLTSDGTRIAEFFECIGGGDPQIVVDRGPTDGPD